MKGQAGKQLTIYREEMEALANYHQEEADAIWRASSPKAAPLVVEHVERAERLLSEAEALAEGDEDDGADTEAPDSIQA